MKIKRRDGTCTVCGMPKKPIGRDAGVAAASGYCDHECPGYMADPKPGYRWPGEQPEAQEPDNVRCARACGWTNIRRPHVEMGGHDWWGDPPDGRTFYPVPDFARDPAFTVRMMERFRLIPSYIGIFTYVYSAAHRFDNDSKGGRDLGHAVQAWVIAAFEAGVEVKR